VVWIVVDIVAIGLFATKGLEPTAALYAVFLCLAVLGGMTWLNAWRRGVAVT
jgi:nicotinamide mononucleotide transporter